MSRVAAMDLLCIHEFPISNNGRKARCASTRPRRPCRPLTLSCWGAEQPELSVVWLGIAQTGAPAADAPE